MASKKLKPAEREDRISELPDIILHSIICNLPTAMAAARTTALSRRWRSLWLSCPIVEFHDNYDKFQLFAEATISSLIASTPRLETLEIGSIKDLSKLSLSSSNVANLMTLVISSCNRLEEIEIEAPRLDTLRLTTCTQNIVLNKIRLTAPELHHLEIRGKFRRLKLKDVVALISKLESLKTLIIGGTFSPEDNTSLRLSVPNLEELTLINLCRLREIDIDGGPQLTKFFLKYDRFVSDKLKICKINHAAACRWELHSGSRGPRQDRPMNFNPRGLKNETQQFYKWKKFMTRFPQFRTFRIQSRFLTLVWGKSRVGIVVVKIKNMEETSTQSKLQGGEVVSVGEGKTIAGKTIDISVKTGDQVVYSKYAGTEMEIELNGENHLLLKEDDIIGILETGHIKDLTPLNDRVLIKVFEAEEMTAGRLRLSEAMNEKFSISTVKAVGPRSVDKEDGSLKPLTVSPGNIVFYSKVAGDDFKAGDGSNYIIIRASDVRVVIS
ncbi:20 kDa chaperonin, chloroplastic [Linum perenne]